MNKKITKILAIQNILVILLSAIIGLFSFSVTESIAKKDEFDFNEKPRIASLEKFSIHADISNVRGGAVQLVRKDYIELDAGSILYIQPTQKLYAYRVEAKVGNKQVKYFGEDINIINVNDNSLPDEFDIQVSYKSKFITGWNSTTNNKIHVKIRHNNAIWQANANRTAAMENGVIYARPEGKIQLSTAWTQSSADNVRKGYWEVDNPEFYVDNASNTVSIPKRIGAKTQVTWKNNYGASLPSITIIASNMVTDGINATCYSVGISGHITGSSRTVYKNVDGYNVQKEIGLNLKNDGDYSLEINLGKEFSGKESYIANANYANINLSDISGKKIISKEPEYIYNDDKNSCVIRLGISEPGILKFTYFDYKNQSHEGYWYITDYDNVEQKSKESKDDIEEPTKPSESGDVYIPANGGNNSNNGNSNNGNNNNSGGNVPASVEETPVIHIVPGYNVSWTFEGNKIDFDVTTSDSDETMWTIQRRTNERFPVPIYGVTYGCYGIDNGHFTIDSSAVSPEGVYDVLLFTRNGDDGYFTRLLTTRLGGKYVVKEPVISLVDNAVRNENTGAITYKYKTENCTEVKYKVIKRDDPNVEYDHSILNTYDGFDGEIAKNPNELTITINPLVTGSGTYDLVIYGINRDKSEDYKYLYRSADQTGIVCNIDPKIKIEKETDTLNKIAYRVSASALDNIEIKERYYAIAKLDHYGEEVSPSIDEMKNPGQNSKIVKSGNFNDGDLIELSTENYGVGYYALLLYAKSSEGIEKYTRISSIMLSEGSDINYTILGEDENQAGSSTSRYVQNVDFVVTNDLTTESDFTYFVSENDYTTLYKEGVSQGIFYNSSVKEEQITKTVKNGEKFRITLNSEKGVRKNVYIYAMSRPHGPNSSNVCVIRTGSICLDGTDMDVNSIYIKDYQKKKTYKAGDELDVIVELNHEVEPATMHFFPMLQLKVGDTILNPSELGSADNKVIYTYQITESTPNGEIKIEDFNYLADGDGFYGEDAPDYSYTKKLKDYFFMYDFVTGNEYVIDTTPPKVESIYVEIFADAIDGTDKKGNAVKYVKDFKGVKVVGRYTEEVTGAGTSAYLDKGNKTNIHVFSYEDGNRTSEEFDFTNLLLCSENSKFEGTLELSGYGSQFDTITDLAGNRIDYTNLPNAVYRLNGQTIDGSKVIFDSSVIAPELYVGNTRISESGIYNTGLVYTCFAEFNSPDNYEDISGLTDTVDLGITYEGITPVAVYDNEGNEIENNYTIANTDEAGISSVTYHLRPEKLPVTFKFDDEGVHNIKAIKTDKLGNKSEIEYEIEAKDHIEVSQNETGLLNIDNNKMYCLYDMEDNEKVYTITLKSDVVDFEDINLYVQKTDENSTECEKIETKSVENTNYGKYQFKVNRSGKYVIYAVDKDDNVVFNGFVEAKNVYIIGDVDFDGKITSSDVIQILRYIVKFEDVKDDITIPYAGNINGNKLSNGKPDLDVMDAVKLARFLAEDPYVTFRRSDKDTGYVFE